MAMLPTASGQSMTGQISGVVLDPPTAVVPGATVTLTNALTGQERQVTSGSQGEFVFVQLLAGEYIVRVNSPGFKVYEQTGLNLSSNEKLVARGVILELGTTSETVEVSAEAGRVETQSSERVGSITTTQIQEIAVSPDRNFMSLLKVVPGVTDTGRGATVLGGRSGQTIVTLDGIVDNDTGVQNTGAGWVQPNIDAISEMKVMLTNYTAEYGVRSGGTINALTTSSATKCLTRTRGTIIETIGLRAGTGMITSAPRLAVRLSFPAATSTRAVISCSSSCRWNG